MTLKKVSTEAVHEALKSENFKVVDTRDSNTFIGWRLGGEIKKGHIAGATDFAAEWLTFPFVSPWSTREEYDSHIEQKFQDKKFDSNMNIIFYDSNGKDAEIVAEYFRSKGFANLFYYNF